jgi:hypothetical protein
MTDYILDVFAQVRAHCVCQVHSNLLHGKTRHINPRSAHTHAVRDAAVSILHTQCMMHAHAKVQDYARQYSHGALMHLSQIMNLSHAASAESACHSPRNPPSHRVAFK